MAETNSRWFFLKRRRKSHPASPAGFANASLWKPKSPRYPSAPELPRIPRTATPQKKLLGAADRALYRMKYRGKR